MRGTENDVRIHWKIRQTCTSPHRAYELPRAPRDGADHYNTCCAMSSETGHSTRSHVWAEKQGLDWTWSKATEVGNRPVHVMGAENSLEIQMESRGPGRWAHSLSFVRLNVWGRTVRLHWVLCSARPRPWPRKQQGEAGGNGESAESLEIEK